MFPFMSLDERRQEFQKRAFECMGGREDFFSRKESCFNVEIKEEDEFYLLQAELPGLASDDIEIDIISNRLTIAVPEKKLSNFNRSFRNSKDGLCNRSFPIPGINKDKIKVECSKGLLTIMLPKGDDYKKRSIKVDSD